METINVELTREELCIIQQALGLREMSIINSTDLNEKWAVNKVIATKQLRSDIQKRIRSLNQKSPRLTVKTISVNGQKSTIRGDRIYYEDICELADINPNHTPSITCKPRGGVGFSLRPGGSCNVLDGMIFSAYVTGGA